MPGRGIYRAPAAKVASYFGKKNLILNLTSPLSHFFKKHTRIYLKSGACLRTAHTPRADFHTGENDATTIVYEIKHADGSTTVQTVVDKGGEKAVIGRSLLTHLFISRPRRRSRARRVLG